MNSKPKQMPAYEVFAVDSGSGDKGFWTKIGAAWPHEDGQGFSLKLSLIPFAGQSIHLRAFEAKTEKGGAQ